MCLPDEQILRLMHQTAETARRHHAADGHLAHAVVRHFIGKLDAFSLVIGTTTAFTLATKIETELRAMEQQVTA